MAYIRGKGSRKSVAAGNRPPLTLILAGRFFQEFVVLRDHFPGEIKGHGFANFKRSPAALTVNSDQSGVDSVRVVRNT